MEEIQQNLALCPKCQRAKASTRKSKLCGKCFKETEPLPKSKPPLSVISPDLLARAALAKTIEDWQKLAAELAPIFTGILNGEVKATAAQASLMKDVMNRAFGKPTAVQQGSKVSAGVIVIPALDNGQKMMICPQCGFNATKDMVASTDGASDSVSSVNS